MRISVVSLLFAALFGLLVAAEAREPPRELEIQTGYLPPDCPTKSTNGDILKVHYVSSTGLSSGSCS